MTTHLSRLSVRPGSGLSAQADEHARELVGRLTARGLRASGEPHRGCTAGATAVAAQRADVHPYAGRLVVLLPNPGHRGELRWHWPRFYTGHEHTGVCWFQPFAPAGAYDDAADRITAAIEADVRRRGKAGGPPPPGRSDGEVVLRRVLDRIGQPLHKLLYRQLEVLDALQRRVEDPAVLRGLYGIDHFGMRALRGLEGIAVLGGVRARELPEPLLLARVLREAASQVKDFPRVRIPPPGVDVALPRDVAPEIGLLLAELIENAARFSPGNTDVLMTVAPGAGAPASGLRIEIADRGELHVPPDQLAALNRLLAAPDSVDLAEQITAGPIGLLVVARLAERHRVRVVLDRRPGGGIRAVVDLPEALLLEWRPPPVSAAPTPPRVTTGSRATAVVPATGRASSSGAIPATAANTELAEFGEAGPRTTGTGLSAELPAGDRPPLPRRTGAHRRTAPDRAVNGTSLTNGRTSGTTTGADVGAAAAFFQGVHAPAADLATDCSADLPAGQASARTASGPPADPAAH